MRDPGGSGGPQDSYDTHFDEFGDIKADIHAMKAYADRLATTVATNYTPEADKVMKPMQTSLPQPPGAFSELVSFLQVHQQAQSSTLQNVYNFNQGSLNFAHAASDMSKKYAGSDAFAHAKVSDVDKELGIASQATPKSTSDADGTGS